MTEIVPDHRQGTANDSSVITEQEACNSGLYVVNIAQGSKTLLALTARITRTTYEEIFSSSSARTSDSS